MFYTFEIFSSNGISVSAIYLDSIHVESMFRAANRTITVSKVPEAKCL